MYYAIFIQDYKINGVLYSITLKLVIELIVEIIYIYKNCETKYFSFPKLKHLNKNIIRDVLFSLKFCFTIIVEFFFFETISFILYKTANKENNIAIWSSCYLIISLCISIIYFY